MPTLTPKIASRKHPVIIVMGVSGSGKSTVGERLGERLNLPFLDADDYHPQTNIDKMSNGVALTDDDRWPWLDAFAAALRDTTHAHGGTVAACSALKRSYRDFLTEHVDAPLVFVYLEGARDTLLARLGGRTDHFMPATLLDSQLATLEPPQADEPAVTVSITLSADELIDTIEALLT